jgi:hypothetical protein
MSEWKPIETAPKDGRDILLSNNEERHYEDRWVVAGSYEKRRYKNSRGGKLTKSGFYNQFLDNDDDGPIYPTHWMPLPEPPKQDGESDDH